MLDAKTQVESILRKLKDLDEDFKNLLKSDLTSLYRIPNDSGINGELYDDYELLRHLIYSFNSTTNID